MAQTDVKREQWTVLQTGDRKENQKTALLYFIRQLSSVCCRRHFWLRSTGSDHPSPPQRAPFIHCGQNLNSNLLYWRNTTRHVRIQTETISQSACWLQEPPPPTPTPSRDPPCVKVRATESVSDGRWEGRPRKSKTGAGTVEPWNLSTSSCHAL